MRFGSETYFEAATEHIEAARELHDRRYYALSYYAAGLAVECMLRAYRYRIDSVFDERHDLYELAKAGRFFDLVPATRHAQLSAWLLDVVTRWTNTHRYRSVGALRAFLRRQKLDRGVKGDYVKENGRRLLNAALEIVNLGAAEWKKS